MDSAHTKPPFCRHQVPYHEGPPSVEERVSGSLHLSCVLRQIPARFCPQVVVGADVREDSWISMFSSVVRFKIVGSPPSLVPLHGFSLVLTHLHLSLWDFRPSQILDLIYSFPLLEDVSMECFGTPSADDDDGGLPTTIQPRGSPVLTRTLELSMWRGMDPVATRLLSLPNGLRFRNLDLTLHCEADHLLTTALVEECCLTLESLRIDGRFCTSVQAVCPLL